MLVDAPRKPADLSTTTVGAQIGLQNPYGSERTIRVADLRRARFSRAGTSRVSELTFATKYTMQASQTRPLPRAARTGISIRRQERTSERKQSRGIARQQGG